MVRINILIPVLNNKQGLMRSLESIESQDFIHEDIFTIIVDFGSVDGSYEEALKHAPRMGVYRLDAWRTKSQRAVSSRFWQEVCPSGNYTFKVVMTPGDVLYPYFLTSCSELWLENIDSNPCLLVCEADIQTKNGGIRRQTPLYETPRVIDGKKEPIEYLKKGMLHSVYGFGGELSVSRYQMSELLNERFWWNNLLLMGVDHNVLYTPERLVCVPERQYTDELWEIVGRWENVINISRRYQSFYGKDLYKGFEETGRKSVAFYALWRTFLLEKRGMDEEAGNCFLMSEVIEPEVRKLPIYGWLEEWLECKNPCIMEKMTHFFELAEDKTVEEWEKLYV